MHLSQIYILIAILILAVMVVLLIFLGRAGQRHRLTPLSGLAFACVVAGMLFGENRYLGYGLIGLGVILAVVDVIRKAGKK